MTHTKERGFNHTESIAQGFGFTVVLQKQVVMCNGLTTLDTNKAS